MDLMVNQALLDYSQELNQMMSWDLSSTKTCCSLRLQPVHRVYGSLWSPHSWKQISSWLFSNWVTLGKLFQFSSLSHVLLFANPWTAAHQASLSFANSLSWLKLMSIESVMPSNHLIFCRPLLLLPSIFPNIRIFSNESVLRISSKVLELQHPSFQWILGLISFRIDWFDLLAVQGAYRRIMSIVIRATQ